MVPKEIASQKDTMISIRTSDIFMDIILWYHFIVGCLYLLVSSDLVRGRRLTSYWGDGVPEEITKAGGTWEDKAVVVDGNLVTSRWPMDLGAFTREMMKLVGRT